MPVDIIVKTEKGWLTKSPLRGDVLVLYFIDQRSRRELFKYAPKWSDVPIILQLLDRLADLELTKRRKKFNDVTYGDRI